MTFLQPQDAPAEMYCRTARACGGRM